MAPNKTGLPTVSVKARSAEALTVVLTVAVLFPGTGSVSLAATLAVFVSVPAAVGLTTIVTVALAVFARVPRLQLTVAVQIPWLGVTETKVTFVGTASVKVTPVAGDGPLLVTMSV